MLGMTPLSPPSPAWHPAARAQVEVHAQSLGLDSFLCPKFPPSPPPHKLKE